ncbi:Sec-independent protein translocase protein TatB [Marivivens aquimaris]|uniref:Sec-independent protein translocase protein TatB n=1 Tax=Marivivens aquimaris TaxID=2774876 RepID=UPI001881581B|nr:Sec-independent protein translocase protein TatB [Marivivens aquimaris]
MFGMGWSEMILVGIVALIVVGPEELPNLFRTVGQYVGKAKGMAREFSRAMDQAADQTQLKDISNTLKSTNQTLKAATNPGKFGFDQAKKTFTAPEPLSPERQETKEKMNAAMAKAAEDRQAREAAASEADEDLADLEDFDVPEAAPQKKTEAGE